MGDGVTIVNITANVKTEEGDSKFVIFDLKSGFIDPDILISLGLKKRWGWLLSSPYFPIFSTFKVPIVSHKIQMSLGSSILSNMTSGRPQMQSFSPLVCLCLSNMNC